MNPSVRIAFVDHRAVILDLREDRYLGLGVEASAALRRACDGAPEEAGDREILGALNARGLAPENSKDIATGLCSALNSASASWLENRPRFTLAAIGIALRVAWCERTLRTVPIEVVIERHRSRKAKRDHCPHSPQRFQKILAGHYWAALLTGSEGRCLSRSLVLARQIWDAGGECNIVIGVMCNPFKAHSWVQANHVVLNDGLEVVRLFTPILVV